MKSKEGTALLAHHPQVTSKKIRGKWLLLEQNRRFARELNETAGFLWNLARQPTSTQELAKKLAAAYDQPLERCQRDVEKFVEEYLKANLLVKGER